MACRLLGLSKSIVVIESYPRASCRILIILLQLFEGTPTNLFTQHIVFHLQLLLILILHFPQYILTSSVVAHNNIFCSKPLHAFEFVWSPGNSAWPYPGISSKCHKQSRSHDIWWIRMRPTLHMRCLSRLMSWTLVLPLTSRRWRDSCCQMCFWLCANFMYVSPQSRLYFLLWSMAVFQSWQQGLADLTFSN